MICGYVQTVAQGLVLGSALKSHTQVVCPQFYTQIVPQLPVVRRTCTSSFSESNIVLDCRCLQVCVCGCVCVFYMGVNGKEVIVVKVIFQ